MGVDAPRAEFAFQRKLSRFVTLSVEDMAILARLRDAEIAISADVDIVREGEVPHSLFMLTEGMAARYRVLPDGGRQILTFMLPGDVCDAHTAPRRRMDHAIGTIVASRVAMIGRAQFAAILARHPRLSAGLQCNALQEEAMLRERIVSLGRRDAHARVAYLLCELLWRFEAIGQAAGRRFCWPLTQAELGDALGLTAVYINRVLRDFRHSGLIAVQGGTLCVLDPDRLQRRAGFSPDYLNVGRTAEPPVFWGRTVRREAAACEPGLPPLGAVMGAA